MRKTYFKKYREFILEDISRRGFLKMGLMGTAAVALGCVGTSCTKDTIIPDMHKYYIKIVDDYNSISSIKTTAGKTSISNPEKEFYSMDEIKIVVKPNDNINKQLSCEIQLYHNDIMVRLLSFNKDSGSNMFESQFEISYLPKVLNYEVELYGEINEVPATATTSLSLSGSSKIIKGIGKATIKKKFSKTDKVYGKMELVANACNAKTYSIFKIFVDGDAVRQYYKYKNISGINIESTIYLEYL